LDERIISIEQSAVERSLQSARASRTSAYFEVLPALDALLNHQSWISTLHSGAYLSRLGAAKAGWRGGEESGAADGHDLRMWGPPQFGERLSEPEIDRQAGAGFAGDLRELNLPIWWHA
jgi:hypothetical protein